MPTAAGGGPDDVMDLAACPAEVRARARVVVDHAPRAGHVLYWTRVAARDHENPALDAAIATANALGTTAVVLQILGEREAYASDRHHTFALEGARDLARGLRHRGVAYALAVERPGTPRDVLHTLARSSALVVTDDVPAPPLSQSMRALAADLATSRVPLVAVDASCVVPMPMLARRYDRAYAFRAATGAIANAALARPWHDVVPARPPAPPALPFEPVDAEALDDRTIARLVAACAIDHSVGPVRTLRGGSTAGYERWETFKATGLVGYGDRRNDAAVDGTSRLSPWLHHGHVSPLRIAREAAAFGASTSRDKFLDELLVWREVAWHYAWHTPDLETLDALPAWARETLAAHAADPRNPLSLERLERGCTGDPLWDLAQRSLVRQGELHNNVRMTWGKALLAWTRSPEHARRALVELNHRYALDGRDPASYGGLYWCLGLFDRPFAPERPILGSVRPRPTSAHASRLDLEAYAARVSRSARTVGRVAVVGAGVAGLACARVLGDHGVDVVAFDKGRVPGGRLATTRTPALTADLGAQYFTVRDERFARFVRSWVEDGVVARWPARIGAVAMTGAVPFATSPVERFVGTPSMSAIARHLGHDVVVRASHRIDVIERRASRFVLRGATGAPGTTLGPRDATEHDDMVELGAFDAVVICLPPEQALPLVRPIDAALADAAAAVVCEPALALAFTPDGDTLASVPFDGLFIGRDGDPDRVLSWAARDSSKPQRSARETWVLHAAPEWSRRHLRDDQTAIESALLDELARILGLPRLRARAATLRRWAFARSSSWLAAGALFDDDARIGLGGDWCAGGRLEGAFLSGVALAGRVLGLEADNTGRHA